MRASTFKIVWNPFGSPAQTLLGWGDLMEEEVAQSLQQLVDVGKFNFAKWSLPLGRGNMKRRLEFSLRRQTPSDLPDHAMSNAANEQFLWSLWNVNNSMWGKSQTLMVHGFGIDPVFFEAVLLDCNSRATGIEEWPLPECVTSYVFDIKPTQAQLGGFGCQILGGEVMTDDCAQSLDMRVKLLYRLDLAFATGLEVGGYIYLGGAQQSGLPNGTYKITQKSGNSIYIFSDLWTPVNEGNYPLGPFGPGGKVRKVLASLGPVEAVEERESYPIIGGTVHSQTSLPQYDYSPYPSPFLFTVIFSHLPSPNPFLTKSFLRLMGDQNTGYENGIYGIVDFVPGGVIAESYSPSTLYSPYPPLLPTDTSRPIAAGGCGKGEGQRPTES